MNRESFVFYQSFHKALEPLPAENYKNVMLAINNYALYSIEPNLEGIELSFFILIKPQIDANNKRYENGKKGAGHGKKGGRPKAENPKETPSEPLANPKETPNENVNANENVNENFNADTDFEMITDPQKLFLYYWQHTSDIFSPTARIKSPNEWGNYWSTSPPTCDQIKTAMNNFIADVREGVIERQYIPRSPDKFVLNNWINTCQERYKTNKNRSPPELMKKFVPPVYGEGESEFA